MTSPASDAVASWNVTLDAFEASLDRHRHLVEHDLADGEHSPWPPAQMPDGPVPEPLRERAAALLARNNTLIDDVVSKMATIPSPKPSRHARHSTPAAARWSRSL